jgi:hypothetical protein
LSHLNGGQLRLSEGHIAATNGVLHQALLALLRDPRV